MARPEPVEPPRWSEAQLKQDVQRAVERFVESRGRVGKEMYVREFRRVEPIVRRLFGATSDLAAFGGATFEQEPGLVPAARFLGGPPVSEDDLEGLVGTRVGKRLGGELAAKIAKVLRAAWDPIRFPWVEQARPPRRQEREAAIAWTSGVWSVERVRTRQRNESSKRQESAVAEALSASGYTRVPRPEGRAVRSLDDLARGQFTLEVVLSGAKCDVPVRLLDGRLLAVECKVSNSAVNSVKRLVRETGGKADRWRGAFGDQVVTAAVLSGVYKLGNLVDVQRQQRVALFWEHDLTPLQRFVRAAR